MDRCVPTGGLRPRRWRLLPAVVACLAAILSFPTAVPAAQEIAILKSADIAAYTQTVTAFTEALGPSFVYSTYDLHGDAQEGRKLARKVRASDASLVLAVGLKAAIAAKLELVDVPVIFCMVLDPARYDLKAPNLTGILLDIPIERHLGALRQVLPASRRIGVLYDPGKSQSLVEEARRQARAQGFELIAKSVSSDRDVAAAARALISQMMVSKRFSRSATRKSTLAVPRYPCSCSQLAAMAAWRNNSRSTSGNC